MSIKDPHEMTKEELIEKVFNDTEDLIEILEVIRSIRQFNEDNMKQPIEQLCSLILNKYDND
jgi:hypothetical protein